MGKDTCLYIILDMNLNKFKYRFVLLRKSEMVNSPNKCISILGKGLYDKANDILFTKDLNLKDPSCLIFDRYKNKTVLFLDGFHKKSSRFHFEYSDLSPFQEFISSDKISYNQNVIRMSSIDGNIIKTYAYGNVWFLIRYLTEKNNERVLINPNIFSRLKDYNTREYKIYSLLNE